jgi:hypothetical protein
MITWGGCFYQSISSEDLMRAEARAIVAARGNGLKQ